MAGRNFYRRTFQQISLLNGSADDVGHLVGRSKVAPGILPHAASFITTPNKKSNQ
jgi:hypothetical protein